MSTRATRSASRRRPAAQPARASSADPPPSRPKRRKVAAPAVGSPAGTSPPANTPLPADASAPLEADSSVADAILSAEKTMSDALNKLSFKSPVTHVYNPLEYAWDAHSWYVRRFAKRDIKMLLVGMNPGPWGMAQTGVPFGEVTAVRDYLQMPADTPIGKPARENAARPVDGLRCTRSEVSGKRLWREWAAARYAPADAFFASFFVHNYCPLMMMEAGGRNRTPVQVRAAERAPVHAACDAALRAVAAALRPAAVVGVGGYATERCREALGVEVERGLVVATLLHPSPASPVANRGWVPQAVAQIAEIEREIESSSHVWE